MRTVLVCVRTPLVAHNVAAMAARLGLSAVVRTAASDAEVMLRLAERACDVVLADTGLARPDPAAFVRRVLARAPGAVVLLIGAEERAAAAAAIAAGARGLVQSEGGDLITGVVKTMLLLAASPRARRATGPATGPATGAATRTAPATSVGAPGPTVAPGTPTAAVPAGSRPGDTEGPGGGEPPAMVPVQRGDQVGSDSPVAPDPRGSGADAPALSRSPDARLGIAPEHPHPGPARRGDPAAPGGPARPGAIPGSAGWVAANRRPSGPAAGPLGVPGMVGVPAPADSGQRIALTEREMQVLIGMADGKSNAEIGRELFVSEDTVKTHARRLFRKLGARDRAHAVAAGFRAGLVA